MRAIQDGFFPTGLRSMNVFMGIPFAVVQVVSSDLAWVADVTNGFIASCTQRHAIATG